MFHTVTIYLPDLDDTSTLAFSTQEKADEFINAFADFCERVGIEDWRFDEDTCALDVYEPYLNYVEREMTV